MIEAGEKEFNAIISLSNSIGFSNIQMDIRTFKEIRKVASPGCILVTETENRDWRIRNFQKYIKHEFKNIVIDEIWNLDYESSVAQSNSCFYKKIQNGRHLKKLLALKITLRLYSLHELKSIFENTGWKYKKCYGNLNACRSPDSECENLVTISQKP